MAERRQLIRCKAPLRISFAGGGTDVPPYCDEQGGAVLNTTIDRFAYCTISPRCDDEITIRSLDFDTVKKWRANGDVLVYDGNLDLIKAVLNHFDVKQGFDMFLHCDAPPGSGLGSSSAVMVSIIGALAEWLNVPMSQYEIANLAYILEREELGQAGGKQDQYAAVFGGFNYIEFKGPETIVTPLRVKSNTLNELHYQLLLGNTGRTRDSSNIIKSQTDGYRNKESQVVDALDNTKRLARETKDALLMGNIRLMGDLLNESWEYKKKFTSKISNDHIDTIYRTAIDNGAVGGKISGAGGGGFMYFICEYDRKHLVANELRKLDVDIVQYNFDKYGLQTWRYCDGPAH
ncbi:GHMP family kinase ATP-binding protein [Methanomassiliicoccus luminyensis]|jgi:D-glycero-alpha-D-manno-heptose-7-phosphate kinase|uniref:GHMP family kinase ATP-binding protein n=1 Tax=Methanomassiliicoccus luminyensis TaxID=1080712 RepID=UPI0009DA791F|nr:GHMP kinase [Methanomassiliicoccus luminyensis]